MQRAVHLIIKGKVQGVFYRATAKKIAGKFSLTGWVKNMPGGNVEAVVSGNNNSVKDFIEWCKTGPANAVVEEVIINERDPATFNTFEIIN